MVSDHPGSDRLNVYSPEDMHGTMSDSGVISPGGYPQTALRERSSSPGWSCSSDHTSFRYSQSPRNQGPSVNPGPTSITSISSLREYTSPIG